MNKAIATGGRIVGLAEWIIDLCCSEVKWDTPIPPEQHRLQSCLYY